MPSGGIRKNSWVGKGRPGPGRPKGSGKLPPPNFFEDEKPEKEGNGKDWAAAIAREVFERNPEAVYEAMSKALLKRGDHRVFTALANRAYGMPVEETSFAQDKPFKLVIEYIGENRQEVINCGASSTTIEGEQPHRMNREPKADRLLSSESRPAPEKAEE